MESSSKFDHVLDHRALYRLPWTMQDNAIAWLEPTQKCNLACDGCYRANISHHKSLDEVAADLDLFAKFRNFHSVSIAGGDPLTHPQILDIVRMIAERGWVPTINTNGLALDEPLARELKKAGVKGFTFHIDSRQNRPGWKNKTEQETNELRLHYAEMVARVGGMISVFNSTVFENTIDSIPDLVDWAQQHIDVVQGMVFICYREAIVNDRYDYYALGQKIDPAPLVYTQPDVHERIDITTPEVVAKIRERHPDFAPCAYLGGTQKANSFKWLISTRFGTKKRIYGYMGPRMMELVQSVNHATGGVYKAYTEAATARRGRSILGAMWPFDAGVRKAALSALTDPALYNPLRRVHMQSIIVIQPIDILEDGRQNMCDGCPDITTHDGRLVWSCRLEECLHFNCFVTSSPKPDEAARQVKIPAKISAVR